MCLLFGVCVWCVYVLKGVWWYVFVMCVCVMMLWCGVVCGVWVLLVEFLCGFWNNVTARTFRRSRRRCWWCCVLGGSGWIRVSLEMCVWCKFWWFCVKMFKDWWWCFWDVGVRRRWIRARGVFSRVRFRVVDVCVYYVWSVLDWINDCCKSNFWVCFVLVEEWCWWCVCCCGGGCVLNLFST